MADISLKECFLILRKKMWLIILLTTLCIAISAIVSYFVLDPKYQTFTTLIIGRPRGYQNVDDKLEYNDLLLSQKLVSTYGELVKTRVVVDEVIANLGLDISYKAFREKVNVNLIKDTEIIKLEVIDRDPVLAAEIANETAQVFIQSVKEIMMVENVNIIDKAQVPDTPIKPRPKINIALASVFGFMMGIILVFLLEYLDSTIKTPDDVERYLNLTVIGAIPLLEENKDDLRERMISSRIFTLENPKSPISEAFRTLRTNIQFSCIDEPIRSLVVTSSGPAEGKSTVSMNIAVAMAQTEKTVLLIDSDLRKPALNKAFNIGSSKGLANILVEGAEYIDVVYKVSKINGLHVIGSGPIPPNPAELLGSNKMKLFIESMAEKYDMVILDSPPIGLVTDSAILSTIVDGTILVSTVGETDINATKRAKDLLDKVNTNILGVVLNKVPIKESGYYKYYYRQYYNSYY